MEDWKKSKKKKRRRKFSLIIGYTQKYYQAQKGIVKLNNHIQ